MGLFSFFTNKKANSYGMDVAGNGSLNGNDIPEEVFIEKEGSLTKVSGEEAIDIEYLYKFLSSNYESRGYDDALGNPDTSYMEQNVQGLKNELERTIRRVKTHYEDRIRHLDFHIESRSKSGMVDIVEELKMKRDVAMSHIEKINKIEQDAAHNHGDSQGIFLSYTRGFRRGLAAISYNEVFKIKP